MKWKLVWRDHTFTEDDITGGDMIAAQVVTQDGWQSCDPTAGPMHAINLLAVMAVRRDVNVDLESFEAAVNALTLEIAEAPGAEVATILQPADAS